MEVKILQSTLYSTAIVAFLQQQFQHNDLQYRLLKTKLPANDVAFAGSFILY